MPKKQKRRPPLKALTALVTTAVIGGSAWWLVNTGKITFKVPADTAAEVTDGDTFVTGKKQIIRLMAVDAPEPGLCGSQEAKRDLEKLVLNKPIYINVIYNEGVRLVADVYTQDGSVIEAMLASGWVYYQGAVDRPEFKAASDKAKAEKLGIYSSLCTQETNPDDPDCVIKGNISLNNTRNYYHFPGCRQYTNTQVQLSLGDQWFCTEKQAQQAGFTKGPDCLDKSWP